MRNIINISLPPSLAQTVHKEVRQGKYASTSEFFRYLLRRHQLAQELKQERKIFEKGKGKTLKSLRVLR
ncbi:MAG: ribbon-helix-helix domain-containing protein [Parcubacteria group bacterium]